MVLSKIHRLKKRRGLTLLELMVVAGILVVGITGLLASFVGSFILNVSNNNKSIAATDAQFVLEPLFGGSYSDVVSSTNTGFTNLPDEIINVTVSAISGGKNIVVTVNWMERGAQRSFEIVTQRTFDRES